MSSIALLERFERTLVEAGCKQGRASQSAERMWSCPVHQDRTPSLSIREAPDGRILFHCHAGCSQDAVLEALGLTGRDLFPDSGARPGGHGRSSSGLAPKRGEQSEESVGDGLTLAQYADAKRLDAGFLGSLGVREVRYHGPPALEIPYYGAKGELASTRLPVAP